MALLYTHTACVYSTIHILQISLIVWLRPFLVCVGGGGFVRGYVFILKMPAGIKECLVSGWWWSENSGVQHVASAAGGLRGNQLCVCFLLMQTPAAVLLRNPFFSLSPPPCYFWPFPHCEWVSYPKAGQKPPDVLTVCHHSLKPLLGYVSPEKV